jgi:hypothetical protein
MSSKHRRTKRPVGRPKGSYGGRMQALLELDRMMAKRKHKTALIKALEQEFTANPSQFFKSVIMPLLPRESKQEMDAQDLVVVEWKSLLSANDHGSGYPDTQ